MKYKNFFPFIAAAFTLSLLPSCTPVLTRSASELALVEDGKPRAIVVTADRPTPVAAHAAEELAVHIEKATGVRLPVVRESDADAEKLVRIYIGDTTAARRQGIEPDALGNDVSVMRVHDGSLYILGREGADDPLDGHLATFRGTLFGVYEFLERFVHVRWLWPGELGTYVPRKDSLAIDASLDETFGPELRFRRARFSYIQRQVDNPDPDILRLGFTAETARNYLHALQVFTTRYRLGDTERKPTVGHHFEGWWEKFGKEHPEWFMLNADGERGPRTDATKSQRRHVAMCVSNPDLHRYIVEEHWDGGDVLSLGEVDARVFCGCGQCLAWDGPQPANPPEFARPDYQPRNVSDRYARFWKTIYEMASKKNPDVKVTTFLYWNYLPAPSGDIRLNENIYGEYVPWTGAYTYFPQPPEREQWQREQWLKWKETGMTLAYRPNYLLGGYVFSNISTWQAGEFFRFAYKNGMVGFDYDSLHGHWAVKGPMLYMHMRLFADPEADIATIRGEYFEAFGPAAKQVEHYFDYWEKRSGVRGGNPVDLVGSYPPAAFEGARKILAEALEAALQSPDAQYADRVRFLQAGLEHGALAAKFVASTDKGKVPDVPAGAFGDDGFTSTAVLPEDARRFAATRQALRDLIAFRREHENLFFADLVAAALREKSFIDIDRLLAEPEKK